jgi:hypothetical protein
VLEPHARRDALEPSRADAGPFDERDPGGRDVVVEQRRVLLPERSEAVEVEVGDLQLGARVDLADRERGAGDGSLHPECSCGAADEGRLPRAKLPAHEHDVARTQANGQLGRHRLGLRCAARLSVHVVSLAIVGLV